MVLGLMPPNSPTASESPFFFYAEFRRNNRNLQSSLSQPEGSCGRIYGRLNI